MTRGGRRLHLALDTEASPAMQAWLCAHPHRERTGLRDRDVIFVRLARDGTRGPISQQALAKLLRRYGAIAGVPQRLAHPHALRGYYATTLAGEGVPIQEIKARLGHAPIETTPRYLAELADNGVGDVLDRPHKAQRRRRLA